MVNKNYKGYVEKGSVDFPEPVIREDLLKISEEEYKKNKSKLDEAICFASLDNPAEIPPFAEELFEKMIRGEMTSKEVREIILNHYRNDK